MLIQLIIYLQRKLNLLSNKFIDDLKSNDRQCVYKKSNHTIFVYLYRLNKNINTFFVLEG